MNETVSKCARKSKSLRDLILDAAYYFPNQFLIVFEV